MGNDKYEKYLILERSHLKMRSRLFWPPPSRAVSKFNFFVILCDYFVWRMSRLWWNQIIYGKPADFILKLALKCNIYEILTHETLENTKYWSISASACLEKCNWFQNKIHFEHLFHQKRNWICFTKAVINSKVLRIWIWRWDEERHFTMAFISLKKILLWLENIYQRNSVKVSFIFIWWSSFNIFCFCKMISIKNV